MDTKMPPVLLQRDGKDNDGNTPLALAIRHQHQACALTLLQGGASIQNAVHINNKEKRDKLAEVQFVFEAIRKPALKDVRLH